MIEITIKGPAGSGKTFIAEMIKREMKKEGKSTAILYGDGSSNLGLVRSNNDIIIREHIGDFYPSKSPNPIGILLGILFSLFTRKRG